MKAIVLISGCILIGFTASGQNGELPPVNYNGSINVCDENPWQLVFRDYFDGDRLAAPWITFNSWNGMPGGDNDNWNEARCVYPYNAIYTNANIEVSGGTVKLKVKKEPASWRCNSCATTLHTNYTNATLALPYTKHFNAGKFEARIKMPTFKYAHSTFWTWHGARIIPNDNNSDGVNEIDICESYGTSGNPSWPVFGFAPTCNYSLHAWNPGRSPQTNPYRLNDVEIANRYPRQTWWDWIRNRYFRQDQFHTYTCEWDTALVRFYLDGDLVSEQWKYYQERSHTVGTWPFRKTYRYKVGSHCIPAPGTWRILQGFPYFNGSQSNLRFTIAIDQEDGAHNNGELGQMEIDYVKMWQRRPENGWQRICDPEGVTISGPDVVCSTATYTVSQAAAAGYWPGVSPNLSIVSSNNSSITVRRNMAVPGGEGWIYYLPADPGCTITPGPMLRLKRMFVGTADNVSVTVSETHNFSDRSLRYHLRADAHYQSSPDPAHNYNSVNTYEWTVDYGLGYGQHYHYFGRNITTPAITYAHYSTNRVRWTLKVHNSCGVTTQTGQMSYYLQRPAPDTASDTNPDNIYVAAHVPDYDVYENAVQARLSAIMLPEQAREEQVNETIARLEMEELAPYLVLGSSGRKPAGPAGVSAPEVSETRVGPNPASAFVTIVLSRAYQADAPVQVSIYDISGCLQQRESWSSFPGNLLQADISGLRTGFYRMEIRQGNRTEHFKIMKQ